MKTELKIYNRNNIKEINELIILNFFKNNETLSDAAIMKIDFDDHFSNIRTKTLHTFIELIENQCFKPLIVAEINTSKSNLDVKMNSLFYSLNDFILDSRYTEEDKSYFVYNNLSGREFLES